MSLAGGRDGSTADLGLTTGSTGQKKNGDVRASLASSAKYLACLAPFEHEHFVEEPWVSRRLFEARGFKMTCLGGAVLDPAAGFGNIVQSARGAGLEALGSDLAQRAPGIYGEIDFLSGHYLRPFPGRQLSIVCNPPFSHIRAFTEKALAIADHVVAILAPTRRLNAAGAWLQALPLTEILYVTPRPSMWPGPIYRQRVDAGLKLGNGREDVCWLIFEKGRAYEGRAGWLHRDGGAE